MHALSLTEKISPNIGAIFGLIYIFLTDKSKYGKKAWVIYSAKPIFESNKPHRAPMKITSAIIAWALAAISSFAQDATVEPPPQFAAVLAQVSAPNGQLAVKLNKAFLKPGVYKKSPEPYDFGQEGDLHCLVLDRNLKPLDTILLKNPLRVRTEFPAGSGAIGATILEYPVQEILLRFNYVADMRHLQFWKIDTARNWEQIVTLPLNFE